MLLRLTLAILASLAIPAAFAGVTYSYDAAGHLTKADYGSAGVILYSYDPAGNLISRQVQPQTTNGCTYLLSATSEQVTGGASSRMVSVTSTTGCMWTAVSSDTWLTITAGSSGNGSGVVSFSIAANVGASPRFGSLTIAGQTVAVTQSEYVPGDFSGDGHPALMWQLNSTGQAAVWYLGGAQGNTYQSWAWLNGDGLPGWSLVSAADLNGDGHPDLIWQNDTSRQVAIWYMGGAQGNTYQSWDWLAVGAMTGWTLVGVADFNRDGHPDLMWQNDSTHQIAVWYMGGANGNTYQSWDWLSAGDMTAWTVIGALDLNADGHPDLIWQNNSTQQVAVWYMGGAAGNTYQSWAWVDPAGLSGWTAIARLN